MAPHRDPPDAVLLESARDGDSEAFGTFYLRHRDAVLRFCGRRAGSPDAVADLTAETFATALQALHGPRPPAVESGVAWLLGIARHKIADAYRRGAVDDRARQRIGMDPLRLEPSDVETILELAEEGDAVLAASALPESQRSALFGRVVEQRTYEELARELGTTETVTRKRVSRALRTLKNRMTETHA
jgi:RNA polymerase sigma-70 factor (ECF subfamily)